MKNVWLFGSNYIIPNIDNVVLGGTAQKDDSDTVARLEDTRQIMGKISEVFPSMSSAPIVSTTYIDALYYLTLHSFNTQGNYLGGSTPR